MDKKLIIIVIFVIILIISILTGINRNNKKQTINDDGVVNLVQAEIEYDEENHRYVIYNENGEIIHESLYKEDLFMYTIDPEYNPKVEDENRPQEEIIVK